MRALPTSDIEKGNSRFWSFAEMIDEVLQRPVFPDIDLSREVPADGTVVFLLVLEGVCVDAFVPAVHHIVVCFGIPEERIRCAGDLEGFVATGSGDDGVGRGNCGNDVLDDTLGHGVGHAGDVEFLSALCGFLE